ncbi:MAG TPA: NAD(P)H-binding protein [Gemmatimonadaceae bacterium]
MTLRRRHVFITGGTGYIGRALIDALLSRGHIVRALVRSGGSARLPPGVEFIVGNPLDASSYAIEVPPADTLVQLVGTPHPGPRKTEQFRRVDLPSGLAAVDAALKAKVRHLVYISVAQPAPVMRSYILARSAVETRIREACGQSWLTATILRPWYVVGPGRRWPQMLTPLYAVARKLPWTREGARRLGLVTREQMIGTLIEAIEHPPDDVTGPRVWEAPRIAQGRAP